MFSKIITTIALFLIKQSKLSTSDKSKVMAGLIEKIGAIPMSSIISFDTINGDLLIRGQKADPVILRNIYESALTMRDSYFRKFLNEQLLYEALKIGIHKATDNEMVLFSKVVIWLQQQENEILNRILNKS